MGIQAMWRRLGVLYVPDSAQAWARTHAMLPTPIRLTDGRIRVFIACCDEDMVGRIGFIDVDGDDPTRVVAVGKDPVLDIGRPGCFDDNGVGPCCVVRRDRELWLYYVGYQRPGRVPYTLFTGLAVSRDEGQTFRRVSEAPILDRIDGELLFRTAACVRPGPSGWRMWYIGGGEFDHIAGREQPLYSLRYLESRDGRHWVGPSRELLRPARPAEIGFGRPFITGDNPLEMWFAVRSPKGYSLSYATSNDGIAWSRDDSRVAFAGPPGNWEREMTCYPAVIRASTGLFMFYNGNSYGVSGVGLAVLEEY